MYDQLGCFRRSVLDDRMTVDLGGPVRVMDFNVNRLVFVTNESLKTYECIGRIRTLGQTSAEVEILTTSTALAVETGIQRIRLNGADGCIDAMAHAVIWYRYQNIRPCDISLMDIDEVIKSLDRAKEVLTNFNKNKEDKSMANCCCEKKPLTGYKKVAGVNLGSNPYYYAVYDEAVEVGSIVQVTGRASGQNLTVDSLVPVEDYDGTYTITEEVCAVVDNAKYLARQEKREKAAKLMKKMDAEIAKMNELDKYARYAQINPDVADLFKELKELGV